VRLPRRRPSGGDTARGVGRIPAVEARYVLTPDRHVAGFFCAPTKAAHPASFQRSPPAFPARSSRARHRAKNAAGVSSNGLIRGNARTLDADHAPPDHGAFSGRAALRLSFLHCQHNAPNAAVKPNATSNRRFTKELAQVRHADSRELNHACCKFGEAARLCIALVILELPVVAFASFLARQ